MIKLLLRGEGRVLLSCRTLIAGVLLIFSYSADVSGQGRYNWDIVSHATTHDLRRMSFVDDLTGWAAGDSGTIVMTSDGGESWITQNSTVEFDVIDISFVDNTYGWAVAQQYPVDTNLTYGTDLLRTTNGGEEWFLERRFENDFYNAVGFVDSMNGCIGGNLGKLLWTDNGGVTWAAAVIDSPEYAQWPIYRIDFNTTLYGVALGGLFDITGLVWKTTDGGKFWTHRRVAGEPMFGSHFFDSLNIICIGGDLDYGSGMVRSTDAGGNWEYTYLGIWGQGTAVSFRTPSEGWAPLGFAGTYMFTVDSGKTWNSTFTPDSTAMFDVVFIDSTVGYMVGARGTVLKYRGPTVAVENTPAPVPTGARLFQNYPNPFNPRTVIRYEIREKSGVTVTIADISGKQVREIDMGIQERGQYDLPFSATDLASGVYLATVFLKPTGGGSPSSQTIKMVLLR